MKLNHKQCICIACDWTGPESALIPVFSDEEFTVDACPVCASVEILDVDEDD